MENSYALCRVIYADATSIESSSLVHFGVKGMKWGIRRTPEQLGHHTIPKGTKLYTVHKKGQDATTGVQQVAYTEPDRANRRGQYALNKGSVRRKAIEDTFEASEDIKVPSREELRSVIEEVNRKKSKDFIKSEAKKVYSEYDIYDPIMVLDNPKINDIIDYVLNYQMLMPSVQKEVVGELKKRGYNAMVDEGLVGKSKDHSRSGLDPLIVFDAKQTLQKIDEKKLSSRAQAISRSDYNHWKRRVNWDEYNENDPW